MEGRKWEDLNMDILVNVFGRVGMESLLLDVPFVCKSWYKASREPQCWEHLIFPKYIKPDEIWEEDSPDRGFAERLAMTYQENLSVTVFMKFIVNRSCGCARIIKLPSGCTEEALEYVANECPRLKVLGAYGFLSCEDNIPKFISKWENLEMMVFGSRFHMKETIAQISLHCNNFISISAPHTYIGKDIASAIVASLPNLRCLGLQGAAFDERETILMILQGCKQLVYLDVRNCWGFRDDDAEILELASHIPAFMCEGSIILSDTGFDSVFDFNMNHELFCDKSDHEDCVYDLSFAFFDDLFQSLCIE